MTNDLIRPRTAAALVLMTLLGGCGGGGGGGSSSSPVAGATPPSSAPVPDDGLGLSGQLAATVKLDVPMPADQSFLESTQFTVGLSDSGRALAAWSFTGSFQTTNHGINWVQSGPSGAWGKPAALPQAGLEDSYFRLAMRMNAAGSAALAYVAYVPGSTTKTPQVARFIEGTGWDAAVYAPMGNNPTALVTTGASWDLTMLSDNSFTYSGRVDSGFSVVQTRADGQQTVAVQAASASGARPTDFSYFAANSTGDGLLYTVDQVASTPYATHEISARFATVKQASFQPVPLGNFGTLCYPTNFEHPLVAVTTARGEGVMAVNIASPNQFCELNELHMVRVYTQGGFSFDRVRLNSAMTYLPAAPAIAVDKEGNALVVWMEATGKPHQRQVNDVVRVMWSRAPRGGAWSTPQTLAINTDVYSEDHFSLTPIAFAMNADGKAVIAMRFGYKNPTISIRRFDFTSGWTPWQVAANKLQLSEPAVAMNAAGQAILVYSGLDADRINGNAPYGMNQIGKSTRMFSLRF